MQTQESEALLTTVIDPRFGEIDVIDEEGHPLKFVKRVQYENSEEFDRAISQLTERQYLNNDVLLTVFEVRGYPDEFVSEVVYEYPEGEPFDETLTGRELAISFRCLLESLAFLQRRRRLHGDVRPSQVFFSRREGWAKLIDRLGDRRSPLQCQMANVRAETELYLPPRLFEQLFDRSACVRHNALKTDTFGLGLCALEVLVGRGPVQQLFDFRGQGFRRDFLCEILEQPLADPLAAALLGFLRDRILRVDEAEVLYPVDALRALKEVPEFRTLWDEVFISDEELSQYKGEPPLRGKLSASWASVRQPVPETPELINHQTPWAFSGSLPPEACDEIEFRPSKSVEPQISFPDPQWQIFQSVHDEAPISVPSNLVDFNRKPEKSVEKKIEKIEKVEKIETFDEVFDRIKNFRDLAPLLKPPQTQNRQLVRENLAEEKKNAKSNQVLMKESDDFIIRGSEPTGVSKTLSALLREQIIGQLDLPQPTGETPPRQTSKWQSLDTRNTEHKEPQLRPQVENAKSELIEEKDHKDSRLETPAKNFVESASSSSRKSAKLRGSEGYHVFSHDPTSLKKSNADSNTTPQKTTSGDNTPQVNTPQVNGSKQNITQVNTPQVIPTQANTPLVNTPQVVIPQTVTPQEVIPQVIPPQVVPPKVVPPQVVPPKVAPPQEVIPQVIPPQVSTPQVAPPQVTTPQVAPPQVTIPQVVAPKAIPSQVSAPQVANPQVAPPQIVIPQVVAPKVATPQVSTTQVTISPIESTKTIGPISHSFSQNQLESIIVNSVKNLPLESSDRPPLPLLQKPTQTPQVSNSSTLDAQILVSLPPKLSSLPPATAPTTSTSTHFVLPQPKFEILKQAQPVERPANKRPSVVFEDFKFSRPSLALAARHSSLQRLPNPSTENIQNVQNFQNLPPSTPFQPNLPTKLPTSQAFPARPPMPPQVFSAQRIPIPFPATQPVPQRFAPFPAQNHQYPWPTVMLAPSFVPQNFVPANFRPYN